MRIANGIAAVLFLFSAVVQVNDPDPILWIVLYGAAAAVCLARGRAPWPTMVILGVVALVWALTLAPGVLAEAEPADLLRTMKHENHAEEAREMGGLLLVSAWMAVLTWDRSRLARIHVLHDF